MKRNLLSYLSLRLMRSAFVAIALLLIGTGTVFAQAGRVSGLVTDDAGLAVIGAVVIVKGDTSKGGVTDAGGAYAIDGVPSDATLTFSSLGYDTQEVAVGGRANIDVQLGQDASLIDEIIVVGYGTQKKEFITGSISQVNAKELNIAPSTNVSNMIAGKLPGLTAIQRSGQPGKDGSTLTVRGISTFAGPTGPLVLVDDIPRDMNTVNPQDIETITVLKDAASTAIYGIQGSNGVILVTTKKGSTAPATITYSGNVSFVTNTNMPELLNAQDYMKWHNKAMEMDGGTPYWTAANVQRMKDTGIYGETDWMNEVFKPFGLDNQHTISVSGGTDRIKYYASVAMLNQDGIVPETTFRRFNVRSNLDIKIAKNLNLRLNLGGYQQKQHEPGFGLITIGVQNEYNPVTQAIYSLPNLATTYTEPETGNEYYLGTAVNSVSSRNPLAYINESGFNDNQAWKFEGNANLEYDFGSINALRGLKAGVNISYDFGMQDRSTYAKGFDMYVFNKENLSGETLVNKVVAEGTDAKKENSYEELMSYGDYLILRPQLTYEREFGRHSVGGLLLYEQRADKTKYMSIRKKGYYADYPLSINMGDKWLSWEENPIQQGFGHSGSAGVVGRFNYAFDKKYLAQISFRSDATYLFAPQNRWKFFPSASVGWIMSEENFIKDAQTPINFIKVVASYGTTGNSNVGGYEYMPMYDTTLPAFSGIFGGEGRTAYYVSRYVNTNLTWATMKTYDVGFDAELWQGKFGAEFHWFYKITDDILQNVAGDYSPSLGGNYPTQLNSGRMDNRGFELTLRHSNSFSNGWAYSLKGSLSWNHNRILSMPIKDNDHSVLYQRILGQPYGSIYGLKAIGLYQSQEEIDNSPYGPASDKRVGDIKYADINGDGIISSGDSSIRYMDEVKIGNSANPEMTFSLNTNVSWKGISLTTLWYGVAITSYALALRYNTGVPDATMHTRPFYANGNAPYYLVENSWREDNRDAQFPRLSATPSSNNAWPSSFWVKNGAYLRLRELALSYDLPAKLLQNTGISGAKISLSGQNLFTISAYKYVDPEMPSVNNGYYPQRRTFTIGVDLTF